MHHHFPDKRALFEHVFAVEQREIADIVARSHTLPDGVDAYLRTIADQTPGGSDHPDRGPSSARLGALAFM